MKKRRVLCVTALAVVFVVLAVCVWYWMPVSFLRGVDSNEVAAIAVFNGTNGHHMMLEDRADIDAVVDNIQSVKLQRGKYMPDVDGFVFSLTFTGRDGRKIDSFIINNSSELRDDPFFYECKNGELCSDLLWALEDRYCGAQ
ncbi:MAG: hypothetical protein IKK21_10255 [Clostridia bacterium]|nr:hypothetical protein [Clostridia bacterium]